MAANRTRLAWLDALRGIAAPAVALHHSAWTFVPAVWAEVDRRVDVGTWGVFVFFLVSGYIIPASLERRGDLRAFWTGRVFRLLPLLLAALALALLLAYAGVFAMSPGIDRRPPPLVALANLSMLQELLGVPSVINVMWTLSYEMAFYLMTAGLFAVRQAHRSAPIAVVLAVAAVPLGLLMPGATINGGADLVAALMGVVVILVIVVTVTANGRLRTAAAVIGGLLGLALVIFGSRIGAGEGLVIAATMFAGTAVWRAEQGTLRPVWAVAALLTVLVCGVLVADEPAWAAAVVLAAGVFALAFRLRHRPFPRWLAHLGVISFSLYLLHPLLLRVVPNLVVFFLVLLVLGHVAYRLVEVPGQRLGRRLNAHGKFRSTSTGGRVGGASAGTSGSDAGTQKIRRRGRVMGEDQDLHDPGRQGHEAGVEGSSKMTAAQLREALARVGKGEDTQSAKAEAESDQ
ncbi:acyltransferase family protein [Microbispora bryophytorum]|uniref:Acyltransferase n=1 Tax=Microbispora bryophytorum subsp. camponoti TaxID=1677852 RepID=A0ABR8L935_9ACTN|nr:acyltransferase [Microbispora camponoti]MBD3146269.1 acyltransferase [Microbispora camponoti]